MTSFYFKYNNATYKAQVKLTAVNGRVSCNIIDVLSDYSNQRVDMADLETGVLLPSKKPLMNAINKGLHSYLDNFPVSR